MNHPLFPFDPFSPITSAQPLNRAPRIQLPWAPTILHSLPHKREIKAPCHIKIHYLSEAVSGGVTAPASVIANVESYHLVMEEGYHGLRPTMGCVHKSQWEEQRNWNHWPQ